MTTATAEIGGQGAYQGPYCQELSRFIMRRVRRVRSYAVGPDGSRRSWTVDSDFHFSGSIGLCHADYGASMVHATPFWEGGELVVQITDRYGNVSSFDVPKIGWTFNLEADCRKWVSAMALILSTIDLMCATQNLNTF